MRHMLKIANFTKSRAILLKILNKSRRKYSGAQLHMLINIPVKFHDSRSNAFELHATQVENCKSLLSQGQ
jgi:hypothetical protein